MRAMSPRSKYWINGAVLRIRFMGGTPEQRKAVTQLAEEWTRYGNLRFAFGATSDAEIRVSFEEHNGSWSYIGTDARAVPAEFPTMNLAIVDRATVLHQFGRAIGFGPEHQNPAGGIGWNESAVIAELAGAPNYWSEETTRRQFLTRYKSERVNGTAFDPKSIMLMPIPARWTLNGIGVSPNETLSVLDKALVQKAYPQS